MSKITIIIILILIGLYLLSIMPKMINRKDFTAFKGYYYAHRGFHTASVPENSLTAFKLAVEKGFGIELDVRLSKDDKAVIFHDNTLDRMFKVDKFVNDLTFDELRNLKLLDSNEIIPSFREVLNLVDGQVPLIIELKARKDINKLSEIVAEILDDYKGVYCIESFHPMVLLWFKKNRPHVIRGQLATNYIKGKSAGNKLLNFILQNYGLNFIAKPDFIAFNHHYKNMLSYLLLHRIFKAPTVAYTIQSIEELDNSRDDFDYFIFENFEP